MSNSQSRRGRPPRNKDDQEVRKSLLRAARECLSDKPAKSVTIREIAERADTNSAMIRYYFENKDGLLAAVIDDAVAGLLGAERQRLYELEPSQRSVMLVTMFLAQHREHPWLSRLIVDEVLNSDNSLRQRFVEGTGASGARLLQDFIAMQKADGYFRADLDVAMAGVSLLSLLVFPFVSAPVLKLSHGVDIHAIDIQEWVQHTVRIFEGGCR